MVAAIAEAVIGPKPGMLIKRRAVSSFCARFYLYGPYKREGFATVPSNQAFDRSLRDRNPNWGLRDLERSPRSRNPLNSRLRL